MAGRCCEIPQTDGRDGARDGLPAVRGTGRRASPHAAGGRGPPRSRPAAARRCCRPGADRRWPAPARTGRIRARAVPFRVTVPRGRHEQPGKRPQQGRLAGAVGADHHREASGLEGEIEPARARRGCPEIRPTGRGLPGDRVLLMRASPTSSALRRAITQRKNGTPSRAVSTPILTSACDGMSRTAQSAASSSAAPARPAGMRVRAGS